MKLSVNLTLLSVCFLTGFLGTGEAAIAAEPFIFSSFIFILSFFSVLNNSRTFASYRIYTKSVAPLRTKLDSLNTNYQGILTVGVN